jgi:ATP-dependent helicase YprA (DUF1998 family)
MAPSPSRLPNAREIRFQQNLQNAHEKGSRDSGYDSESTRKEIADNSAARAGIQPYEWQIDVSEALLLGLDAVVIAGTGSGKTLPFYLPLFTDHCKNKMALIVLPLKTLQHDMVRYQTQRAYFC